MKTSTRRPHRPGLFHNKAARKTGPYAQLESISPPRLVAQTYDSQFSLSHDTYNGMGVDRDGKIYYVLCCESWDLGGQMYCFDPATRHIKHLGDLSEACGEKGRKAVPQSKSHVNFVEHAGKLYFATHVGIYTRVDGIDRMPVPRDGYAPYLGGHLLAYEIASERFEDLATAPDGEGIITMNMDPLRARIYGLTWPKGCFFHFDLKTHEWKDFGPAAGGGEEAGGQDHFIICRSIAIDPRDGSAYLTRSTGEILRYHYDCDRLETVEGEDLRKDYFGFYDPHLYGHMGYHWRQTAWHAEEEVFYGIHGNSGYLFRFDPRQPRVDLLERLTSEPSRRCGMFDQFSYGYLGFALGPDGQTFYYLTGGPVYLNGKRVVGKSSIQNGDARGLENCHLITYHLPTKTYRDHGAFFYESGERPTYVNSIAVGRDGAVYSLGRMTVDGETRTDLFGIPAASIHATECSFSSQNKP